MKILEVIPDLSKRAGAEVFFYSLCQELSKDSSIELVVVVIWDKIDPSFIDLSSNPRIHFYCCGKNKKGINGKVIRMFREIVLREKPEVIHTHRSVLLTYFLSFGLKKYNWKYFHTVHNIANKEAGRYEIILRKAFVRHHLINHIGISKQISKSISILYNAAPIATIYNGISFKAAPSSDKKYDFICIARFSKQKNHLFLLNCFNELLKSFPSSKMLLVGEGELMNECKNFCVKQHLSQSVEFYGPTSSVEYLLGESKIFVLGSLYEGNPISILEAMSSGLPIIAPCVGGIPDIVSDCDNGILYDVNNSEQLVYAMKSLLGNTMLQKEIGQHNIEKSKKFSMQECAHFYKEIFKSR